MEVAASPHATAAGVGALARVGAEPGRALDAVVGPTGSPTCYEPTMAAGEAADRLARFERAVAPARRRGAPDAVVSDARSYDVAIIGAGVVGTAIGRQLARYRLRTVILERAVDVGTGTSKANTAIVHTGFDTEPGSLESTLVRRGHQLLTSYAGAAGIALERTGAVLVAWDEEQEARLDGVLSKARANGYERATRLTLEELRRREPHLGPGATGAVAIPDESIICPWSPSIAFATEAVGAGVELRLGTAVTDVRRDLDTGRWLVQTTEGPVRTEWVVNAAGVFSDRVNHWFGHDEFTIAPRRGQLIVFDKLARPLVSSIVLPVPTQRTKGVLVAPTVYGNVLLGPTAEDIDDREDTATTAPGLEGLLEAGRRILPDLVGEEVTATYAGVRAATEHRDYQISDPRARALRVRGRDPLDRLDGVARHRRTRRRPDGRGRSLAGRGGPRAGHPPDARARRARPAGLRRRREGARRSDLRAHRVLLRAGHRGRGQGCAGRGRPRGGRRGRSPSHPGHQWALSGLLLRRSHRSPPGGAVSG